jgi:hypothetical protein
VQKLFPKRSFVPVVLGLFFLFFVAMTQILAKNKNTSRNNGHEIIVLLL